MEADNSLSPGVRQRLIILMVSLALFMGVLVGRAIYLQIYKAGFFKEKSQQQLNRVFTLYPNRGSIYDRNGNPLAISKQSYSPYAIPSQIEDKKAFAKSITHIIGGSWRELEKRLNTTSPFVWVKRKLSKEIYERLKALDLKGLDFIKEQKRVYPKQDLGSHILGFVGIDNQGLAGIEYSHDKFLKGSPGKVILEGDPRGVQLISGKRITTPPNDGGNIFLTIDEFIQYSTQKHLLAGIKKTEATGGYAVVIDPKNGDILATATVPTFNPNSLPKRGESRKNRVITDVFEPGSVFKIVTIAALLEEKLATPGTVFEVPETISIKGHQVKEAHEREEEEKHLDKKTVTEILTQSLNVGTSLLSEKIGEKRFYKYIRAFGFGESTGIALPGESAGLVRPVNRWSGIDYAMFSFGQGLAVNAVQLTANLGLVANKGERIKPRIIARKEFHDGKSVKANPKKSFSHIISEETAGQITEMLVENVNTGTGVLAQIPGYKVAGKTGTAQKAREDGRGYQEDNYMASFFAYFPAEDPQYVIFVAIDSPQTTIYGGVAAAPVFKNIANDIIRMKHIPPYEGE